MEGGWGAEPDGGQQNAERKKREDEALKIAGNEGRRCWFYFSTGNQSASKYQSRWQSTYT